MIALCIIDEVTASGGQVTFPVVDRGLYDFRPHVLSGLHAADMEIKWSCISNPGQLCLCSSRHISRLS